MSDAPELLPCPFCGSSKIRPRDDLRDGRRSYYYLCVDCMATSPTCEKKELAFAAWNTRADPPIRRDDPKIAALVEALELCPPDKPQMTDKEFRDAINKWWKLYARAAIAAWEGKE